MYYICKWCYKRSAILIDCLYNSKFHACAIFRDSCMPAIVMSPLHDETHFHQMPFD